MSMSNAERQKKWREKLKAKLAADAAQVAAVVAPVDPASCDPVAILRQIAVDTTVAAGPRVAACRQLLALEARIVPAVVELPADEPLPPDKISARAIVMMKQGRVH